MPEALGRSQRAVLATVLVLQPPQLPVGKGAVITSHAHLISGGGLTARCSHRFDFIYDLFEHVPSRSSQDTLKGGSKHRRPTVSSQFKVSLQAPTA